jgi:hypothetical protein
VLSVVFLLVIDLAVVGFDMQSGKTFCLSLLLAYSRLSSFYRIRWYRWLRDVAFAPKKIVVKLVGYLGIL